MLKRRHLLAMLSVTLVFVIAAAMLLGNRSGDQPGGSLLLPDLLGSLNAVAQMTVTAADGSFRIENSELGWHIPQQGNYRADANKIHKLLVGLSSLRRIEPKTAKPKLYAAIGLQDPDQKGATSVALNLTDKTGASLVNIIIGQRRPGRGDPSSEEYYVRLPGDPQSWLVEGALPPTGPRVSDWLDKKIALINESRLRQTRVKRPDGEVITAYRDTTADRNFKYRQLPEQRQLADEWRMNDLGKFIANLDNQNVYAKDNAPASEPMLEADIQTFDGLTIKMLASNDKNGAVFVELSAIYDQLQSGISGEFKDEQLQSPEQVRAEVEQLNRRWRGWVYQLPDFKAEYLKKRQVDFLKQ